MKQIVFLFFLAVLLGSCVITETPGFYSGYDRLSENDKKQIVFVNRDSNICNLRDNSKIFSVNGKQLRECLVKDDTSIVYNWAPRCKGKNCISIKACQDYCKLKKYQLYVIADYYDIEMMRVQNYSIFPMLAANQKYYKKDYCIKLNRLFKIDLLNGEILSDKERHYRFLLFKGDKLIKCLNSLFEI